MTSGVTPHSGRTLAYAVTVLLLSGLAAFSIPCILAIDFGYVILRDTFEAILKYSICGGLLIGGITGFVMDFVMEHLHDTAGAGAYSRSRRTEAVILVCVNVLSVLGFALLFHYIGDFHFPKAV
jgi:hypothetical protein